MRVAKLSKLNRSITPSDLRNPKNASGYDYVTSARAGVNGHGEKGDLWRAERGAKSSGSVSTTLDFRGPSRKKASEAAQDFCDYFNGNSITIPAVLKTPGHEYEVDERDDDPEYQAALGVMRDRKAQRAGKQGYVYLIVEAPNGRVDLSSGKIGYSTNPEKRVAELQTGNKRPLRLLLKKPGTEADERALHRRYIEHNEMQEWFQLTKQLLLEWDPEHQVGVSPGARSIFRQERRSA